MTTTGAMTMTTPDLELMVEQKRWEEAKQRLSTVQGWKEVSLAPRLFNDDGMVVCDDDDADTSKQGGVENVLLLKSVEFGAPLEVIQSIVDALQTSLFYDASANIVEDMDLDHRETRNDEEAKTEDEDEDEDEEEGRVKFVQNPTALHAACRRANENPKDKDAVEIVKLIVRTFPDSVRMATMNENGKLPIHFAAQVSFHQHQYTDESEIVRLLLETYSSGASVKDSEGQLPLHIACAQQIPSPAIVSALFSAYPSAVRIRDVSGDLPLHRCCLSSSSSWYTPQHVQIIGTLLKAHPGAAKCRFAIKTNDEKCLPLHMACRKDRALPIVKELLKAYPEGAITSDRHGRLPLHNAAQHGRLDLVEELLRICPNSARHAAVGDGRKMPLHCILDQHTNRSSHVSVANELLQAYPHAAAMPFGSHGRTALHVACDVAHDPNLVFSLLRACPSSAGVADNDGNLPLALHTLCSNSYCNNILPGEVKPKLLRTILRANPSACVMKDKRGRTPLHLACENRDREYALHLAVAILSVCPGSAQIQDDDGSLPLHLCRHDTIAEQLISAFPQGPTIVDSRHGWLPLHRICADDKSGPHHGLLTLLLRVHPQGTMTRDVNGQVPLHLCVHPSYAEELLRVEPKAATLRDEEGRLPLHTACQVSPAMVWPVLKAHPLAVGQADSSGQTPVHVTCSGGGASRSAATTNMSTIAIVREMRKLHRRSQRDEFKTDSEGTPKRTRRCTSVVRMTDSEGRTPLHVACARGSDASQVLVSELLRGSGGAALRQADSSGMVPFVLGSMNGASPGVLYQLLRTCPDALPQGPIAAE